MSTFTILGANKKAEVRSQQLKQQRDDWVKQGVEAEKRNITLSSKILYNVDFDFTEVDKETAIEKMTAAAVKVRLRALCVTLQIRSLTKYACCLHSMTRLIPLRSDWRASRESPWPPQSSKNWCVERFT